MDLSITPRASRFAKIAPSAVAWSSPVDVHFLTYGSWLDQVKAQHVAITNMLACIIDNVGAVSSERVAALQQLSHLLTAHSVAEEKVLHPALVFAGLSVDTEDPYREQQFQKVLNAEIGVKASDRLGAEWREKLKHLQDLILLHAEDHEEKDYYLELQARLNMPENAVLTSAFRAQFLSVR